MKKSIAEIIDELSITNCKIFWLTEKVNSDAGNIEDMKKIQKLNKYRSELKNAINEELGGRNEIKV